MCSKKEILWVESHDLSQTDNSYYGVFFSKVEWWVVELLFLSLNNWGLNFLQNESSQFSQIYLSPEKLSKVFTFQSCKWLFAKLSKFTKMTTIFTQIVVLSENRCHFVNLLSFASSYIFLSLRKITWLNSQEFHLRTQNEELTMFCSLGISYHTIWYLKNKSCLLGRLVLWRMEAKGFFLASMCNWTPASSSPYSKSLYRSCALRYLQ